MAMQYIVDEKGHKTGVILDIEDYYSLIGKDNKVTQKRKSFSAQNDPLLKSIGSVEYGNLTLNIDEELYGE